MAMLADLPPGRRSKQVTSATRSVLRGRLRHRQEGRQLRSAIAFNSKRSYDSSKQDPGPTHGTCKIP